MEKTRRLLLKAAGAVGAAGVLSATRPDTGAAQAPLQIPARPGTNPADLILTNGKIITVDPAFTIAQAIAIAGDRILAVGPDAALSHLSAAQLYGLRRFDRDQGTWVDVSTTRRVKARICGSASALSS